MYTQHFGLRAEPFSLTPDPAFLYRSPGHCEALAALEIGLRGRRGLIVMTGEVGTGKTTLLYSLLTQLGSEVRTAYISNTKLSFDHMLQQALADFGVSCPLGDRLGQLTALNGFLHSCATDGVTAALVIDEAQNLDAEAFENLRLLSNFETFASKLLQIVLVGQPELEFKLKSPNLRQVAERVAVHCHINPLSWSESRKYVEHRLQCVGGSVNLFTPRALRLAIRRSQGIPRRINIICHNALLFAYGQGARTVSRSHVRAAVRERDGRGLVVAGSSGHAAQTSRRRWLGPWLAAPGTMVVALAALTVSWHGAAPWQDFGPDSTTPAKVDSTYPPPSRVRRILNSQWWIFNPAGSGRERLSPNDRQNVMEDLPFNIQQSKFNTLSKGTVDFLEQRASTSSARAVDDPIAKDLSARPEPVEGRAAGLSTIDGPQPVFADAGETHHAADDTADASPPRPSDSAPDQSENEGRPDITSREPANNSGFRLVHIAPGATLGSLTREVYGVLRPDLLERVRAANPQIADMNHILAGDTLRFPPENASGQTAAMIEQATNRANHE